MLINTISLYLALPLAVMVLPFSYCIHFQVRKKSNYKVTYKITYKVDYKVDLVRTIQRSVKLMNCGSFVMTQMWKNFVPYLVDNVVCNWIIDSFFYHSAGKHDRRHYTHHTIYPCTIYPLHCFKALRLTESSLTGIF